MNVNQRTKTLILVYLQYPSLSNLAEFLAFKKKIPVLLTVYVENRKEPYGIKCVLEPLLFRVSWTVTFHVYRFDFIIGGMKDGMLEMLEWAFFRGSSATGPHPLLIAFVTSTGVPFG